MKDNNSQSRSKAFLMPVIMIVLGVIVFLPAWSLRFWQAWIWWSIMFGVTVYISAYLVKKNPDLLKRRTQFEQPEENKKSPVFLKLSWIGYIIPGLDFRFHWSTVPVWVVITANVIVLLGYLLIVFVFRENTYASATVQVEEQQQVISTGVYTIVRHPMYLGLLLMGMATPLALGSYWAIIPFLLTIPSLVIRIKGEEALLLRDLGGYREYCERTRYRMIPYVW